MSESSSMPIWDAYLSLVGEINKVTEVVGAGLAVAARLNYKVMSSVVCLSSHLIQLMLFLIAKVSCENIKIHMCMYCILGTDC